MRGNPMWMRICSLAAAIVFTLLVAGCGKTYTYKYRITVVVRDHGERKNASNVVSVRESSSHRKAGRPLLCGEATVIPLRNNRYLFVLLSGAPHKAVIGRYQWFVAPTEVLLSRLGLETQWSWKSDDGILALPGIKTSVDLKSYEMPDIVTFRDTRDPATVSRVDPEHPDIVLGEGIGIEKVEMRITDERVTRGGVKSVLPWLNTGKEFLDGSSMGEAVQAFRTADFTQCSRLTE